MADLVTQGWTWFYEQVITPAATRAKLAETCLQTTVVVVMGSETWAANLSDRQWQQLLWTFCQPLDLKLHWIWTGFQRMRLPAALIDTWVFTAPPQQIQCLAEFMVENPGTVVVIQNQVYPYSRLAGYYIYSSIASDSSASSSSSVGTASSSCSFNASSSSLA